MVFSQLSIRDEYNKLKKLEKLTCCTVAWHEFYSILNIHYVMARFCCFSAGSFASSNIIQSLTPTQALAVVKDSSFNPQDTDAVSSTFFFYYAVLIQDKIIVIIIYLPGNAKRSFTMSSSRLVKRQTC